MKSRKLCGLVKNANRRTLDSAITILERRDPGIEVLDDFLNDSVTLVPVPRSAPLVDGALWPSEVVAETLQAHGFGEAVLPCISRVTPVRKSAFQAPGNRPTIEEHYDSLEVQGGLFQPDEITLVDDVITKGSTQLACAMRLRDVFPNATIRAFAMVRTKGFGEIETIVSPYQGRIFVSGLRGERDD